MERGDKAEAQGQVEEALAAYDEAARYAPQDTTIVGRGAILRSKLVRSHVDNAERLALGGNVSQATEELRAAMRIDPTNAVVAERIAQMEAMKDDESARPPTQIAQIEGMPHLKVQDGKHNFDLRGDTKSAYRTGGAGCSASKPRSIRTCTPRNVRLRVDNVDFNTAMSLLGATNRDILASLECDADLRGAGFTPEKRRQYGVQAEQTFVLPSSVAPEEMTELLRVLREITGFHAYRAGFAQPRDHDA